MTTVISVESISKSYRLGQISTGTFANDLSVWWARVRGKPNPLLRIGETDHGNRSGEELWALKDVSFTVQQGEVLGIIGRNGAGKSTLLKILSRVTAPTSGRIRVKGRIASLLEVGTGFHPELTGRENIYLNGAILGMNKPEVTRKFDEIVAFAEVEQFIDTPVKRYSSGMYVRLAFAVAAHLDPEILIVDEVLAVGDAAFQKKCLGKMGEVAQGGRTVLFVSHNMAAVGNLCTQSLILQNGKMVFHGETPEAIQQYQEIISLGVNRSNQDISTFRPKWATPLIDSVRLLNGNQEETDTFLQGSDIVIEMSFNVKDRPKIKDPVMGVVISHAMRGVVGGVNTRMTGQDFNGTPTARARIQCRLKQPPLLQGNYLVDVWLGDGLVDVDTLTACLHFSIEAHDIYGTSKTPFQSMGVIYLLPEWRMDA